MRSLRTMLAGATNILLVDRRQKNTCAHVRAVRRGREPKLLVAGACERMALGSALFSRITRTAAMVERDWSLAQTPTPAGKPSVHVTL